MYSLGIDIGTSGIRAVVMDEQHDLIAQAQKALPQSQPYCSMADQVVGYSQNPMDWWQIFETVIFQLSQTLKSKQLDLTCISHLAIDGTSGTVLFTDASGTPCSEALMYNDQRATKQAREIAEFAPVNTAAIGSTSSLAKLLWLNDNSERSNLFCHAVNQSDWLSGQLMAEYRFSDHNNALKMGYDPLNRCWPQWLIEFLESHQFPVSSLPRVFVPGQIMASIAPEMQQHFGFHPELKICAGTTDSTAAIIATGAKNEGEAITSLGSSLVMKVISKQPIFDPQSGVYSQPYGDLWLVGGSSNSGGAVLKSFFCPTELSDYTDALNKKIHQGQLQMLNLDYYPLLTAGERFPIHDPALEPKLSPRPEQQIDFFQALLEGMANIETMAYQRLLELGAPYPKRVISVGGGAFSKAWRYIREQKMEVPVLLAEQQQAASGTALLAQSTWDKRAN